MMRMNRREGTIGLEKNPQINIYKMNHGYNTQDQNFQNKAQAVPFVTPSQKKIQKQSTVFFPATKR